MFVPLPAGATGLGLCGMSCSTVESVSFDRVGVWSVLQHQDSDSRRDVVQALRESVAAAGLNVVPCFSLLCLFCLFRNLLGCRLSMRDPRDQVVSGYHHLTQGHSNNRSAPVHMPPDFCEPGTAAYQSTAYLTCDVRLSGVLRFLNQMLVLFAQDHVLWCFQGSHMVCCVAFVLV